MIENIKTVSNPLTIIAIFAAFAEVAGTVVLVMVDVEIQTIFVWFVMIFPVLLIIAFFLTLNFNSKALYAPSDFKEEKNFLEIMMYGGSSFDRQNLQSSPPDKQALSSGSLNKQATGNLFWLGHDLMWTADTLLRKGPIDHILIGFDQAIHHLIKVGLIDTPVERDIKLLRAQIRESKELSSSLRDEAANKIGIIIDSIGSTLEAAQAGFKEPPYWNRER